jgi:lysophospholipase L1-like esterase
MRLPIRSLSGGTALAVVAGVALAAAAVWTGITAVRNHDARAAACRDSADALESVPWASPTPTASPTAAAPPPPAVPAPGATKLMIVGDSITHGSTGDWTWRYRLYQHLAASGAAVDFVGPYRDLDNIITPDIKDRDLAYKDPRFDQDHAAQYGQPLSEEAKVIKDKVSKYNPDYVVALLGINDLGWYKVDPSLAELSLKLFIANARAGKPNVRIILGKILPAGLAASDPGYAARADDFNRRLVAAATTFTTAESPIGVADGGPGYAPDEHTWDGTHPNPRGEVRIAAAFADVLATTFGLGRVYPRPFPDLPVGPDEAPKLSVQSTGPTTAEMKWTPSFGATGYWVWMKDDFLTKKWTKLPTPLNLQTNPWQVRNLAAGVTYRYRLQAAKGTSFGAVSNEVSLTVPGKKRCP